jgi:hypothetical protein
VNSPAHPLEINTVPLRISKRQRKTHTPVPVPGPDPISAASPHHAQFPSHVVFLLAPPRSAAAARSLRSQLRRRKGSRGDGDDAIASPDGKPGLGFQLVRCDPMELAAATVNSTRGDLITGLRRYRSLVPLSVLTGFDCRDVCILEWVCLRVLELIRSQASYLRCA